MYNKAHLQVRTYACNSGGGLIKNTTGLCVFRRQIIIIFSNNQILEKWD